MYKSIKKGENYFPFFILLVIITSCVREEVLDNIKSDYFQPQLVIHSLLFPGDSVFVSVGQAVPLKDSVQATKVTEATVILSNDHGDNIQLPLIQNNFYTTVYGISQQNFPIQAGHTYTLSVTHPTLPKVEATCTVPMVATPLTKVAHIGNSLVPGENNYQYNVQASWYDRGEYLHRIYFTGQYEVTNSQNDTLIDKRSIYRSHNPIHGIEQVDSLFTYQDVFFQGGSYVPLIYGSDSTYRNSNEIISTKITYHLITYLITPDEHMARYQAALDFYSQNRDALNSDSFIEFYRGIIPEYSNVRGGLGVFGAYLRSEPVNITLE